MTALKRLFDELQLIRNEGQKRAAQIETQIQETLERQWQDWGDLQTAIAKLESDQAGFACNEQGVRAFVYFPQLTAIDSACRAYFETYISDAGIWVNWKNESLGQFRGHDCLIIQSNNRFDCDNGVWQEQNQIIPEYEYRTDATGAVAEDGEVNEDLRNELIERYMEKTGYYPDVFHVTRNGDVFLINTQKKVG
jgi:hypothetical protein